MIMRNYNIERINFENILLKKSTVSYKKMNYCNDNSGQLFFAGE